MVGDLLGWPANPCEPAGPVPWLPADRKGSLSLSLIARSICRRSCRRKEGPNVERCDLKPTWRPSGGHFEAAVEAAAIERRQLAQAATASGRSPGMPPACLAALVLKLTMLFGHGSCWSQRVHLDNHHQWLRVFVSSFLRAERAFAADQRAPQLGRGIGRTLQVVRRPSVDAQHACSGMACTLAQSMSRAACHMWCRLGVVRMG